MRICLCAAVLAVLAAPAWAAPILIDFDTKPDGTFPGFLEPVGVTYASLGVTFSGGGLTTQPVFNGGRAMTLGRASGSPFDLHAAFSTPVESVGAQVFTASSTLVTMTAFDSGGGVLGSTSVFNGNFSTPAGLLTLDGIGAISRVIWTTNRPIVAGVGIDDLRYDTLGGGGGTPTPEPATWALVGAGAAVVLARRRRRRA